MTAKRQRGTGTVEQAGSAWRFRCPDGAGGRYTSPAEYSTPEAARVGLTTYRKARLQGELAPVKGLTLRQYVEDTWLPRMEKRRPRSVKTYRSNWNSQISLAKFADQPLTSLKRRDVDAWVDKIDLSHPEHPAAVLKTILAAAIRDEYIESNPAAGLRLERQKRESTCPTAEEEQAILTCGSIPYTDRLLLAFVGHTALRPGEWRNLRLEDLHHDADEPFVHVCRGSDEGGTKGGDPRDVPLFGVALDTLIAWLAILPNYAPANPLGLVFPHADGKRRSKHRPMGQTSRGRSIWHEYRETAGVTRPIRLHDFRHRAVTALLQGERGGRQWTLREVQGMAGHASLMTTEGTYAHDLPVVLRSAAREMRSVQNSPQMGALDAGNAAKQASNPPFSQLSRSSSPDPVSLGVLPQIAPLWTDAGLTAELGTVLARLRARTMSHDDALDLGARLLEDRRGRDRVELAAGRLDGPHWRAAIVELVELLVAPNSPAAKASR